MRKGKNPCKALTSSEVEKMNIEQARKELKQARDESLWMWLTAKRDIMAEVMVDESNPEWAREEAQQSYEIICYKLEKLARKMDDAADKDSMKEEEEQTVFNPEIEYDFEQLGELVYDCITKQYTNEKGQVFKERADGCFELVKSRRVCLGGLNLAELFAHPVEDNNND